MDLGATAALAAVTWTNGVQRVPAGALVLRRVLGGPWTVVDADAHAARWQVVGWWAPVTASLVVRESAASVLPARRTERRASVAIRRARPWLRALRALGGLELAALLVGVPWGASRFGLWGLCAGVAAVVALTMTTAVVASVAIGAAGSPWRRAVREALPLLSPFGAPRAADLLLERVVGELPPEIVARVLLSPDAFAALIRPRAYDALRAGGAGRADGRGVALVSMLGAGFLASLVDAPPPGRAGDEAYCPRCASLYDADVGDCGDCEGVALVPGGRA